MSGVLVSAGERDTLLSRAGLLGYIGALVVCFVALHHLLVSLGADPVVVQIGEWLVWLTWLAIVFPASRSRTVSEAPHSAYRIDLIRQIVPGFAAITAINFAPIAEQLIHSAEKGYWDSPLTDSPLALGLAAVLVVLGGVLVLSAVRAIGLPAAAFLEEYQPQPPPQRPVGPYAWIRHPIAVGGMCVMTATTLAFGVSGGIWVVNILMLSVYGPLEDLRLQKVFGSRSEYSRTVPRFIPRLSPARAGR